MTRVNSGKKENPSKLGHQMPTGDDRNLTPSEPQAFKGTWPNSAFKTEELKYKGRETHLYDLPARN